MRPLLANSHAAALALFILAGPIPLASGQEAPRPATSASITAPSPRDIRTFHRLFVRSGTVYMTNEQMQDALCRQPEFVAWGLELVYDSSTADLVLRVTRLFLTFGWVYKLIDARNETVAARE